MLEVKDLNVGYGQSHVIHDATSAELLKVICKNRSILIIEHDMEFVSRIAHKVTVLHLHTNAQRAELSSRSA